MSSLDARRYIDEWIDKTVLASGRCSSRLRTQLSHHWRFRIYHVHSLMDDLRRLEGREASPSMTKPPAPFEKPPLIGLWHKHHSQPGFLARNIVLHWKSRDGRKQLDRLCNDLSATGKMAQLPHHLGIDGYGSRAAAHAITGEWIVFVPFEGRNYYLTLGKHGKDRLVVANTMACMAEFPELRHVYPN